MKRIVFLLVLASLHINAQSLNDLFTQSIRASEEKDYPKFLLLTQQLDNMRPMHPTISYNLASAYAYNKNDKMTLNILKRIALMDTKVEISDDETFIAFTKTAYYDDLKEFKKVLDVPLLNSEKVTVLNDKLLHPEGLVYLQGQGWLATSLRKRKIVSFDIKSGNCNDWLSEKDMLAVFSIKADKEGKYIWAATAAIPEMEGYNESMEGKSEVLKVDIMTKEIVKRFSVEGNHLFGDLLVTNSGEVYVSDSNTPAIYKIERDGISKWLDFQTEAYNFQGITVDEKNHLLFVADYLKGIAAISLKDKKHVWFTFPEGTIQKGIDGLTYYNNTLLAIHNGIAPIRIIQYKLNEFQNAFVGYTIIDNNREEFNEPVLGTIYNDEFYFFGNSPWKAYNKQGKLNENLIHSPVIYKYDLKK